MRREILPNGAGFAGHSTKSANLESCVSAHMNLFEGTRPCCEIFDQNGI